MSLPFNDQSERDYSREQEAAQQREHLRLVHGTFAGSDEAADAEVEKLALDFAETTDSFNFILARLVTTSDKTPDLSLRVWDFLHAVIGATGGSMEFVEVTDDELAARMGSSPKTVQRARNELRTWPSHTKLVEIKEHW